MKRFLYELSESWKIAVAQMRSNKTRSTLTALGVIIGIVAVTLMGTAIGGIQVGFDKSMAIFGDDVLYVSQWPWKPVDDWWNFRDRKKIKTEYAEPINRIIAATPNSNLVIAVPTSSLLRSVKNGQSEVSNVLIRGTVSDYLITSTFDFKEGRFFNDVESRGGANVCVIGYDVADNQIDTLTKAFQATTVACARCHDHKLDAVSMKDYYALLGILRELADGSW